MFIKIKHSLLLMLITLLQLQQITIVKGKVKLFGIKL